MDYGYEDQLDREINTYNCPKENLLALPEEIMRLMLLMENRQDCKVKSFSKNTVFIERKKIIWLKIGSKMLKMKSQIPLILVGKSPHWKNMK
jgi:hypothetical protein